MLTANEIEKILKRKEEVIEALDIVMPKAKFVFKGGDNNKIYCNAVVLKKDTDESEILDIQEKTNFENINIKHMDNSIYHFIVIEFTYRLYW